LRLGNIAANGGLIGSVRVMIPASVEGNEEPTALAAAAGAPSA
jgi:hypothetical protein